MGGRRSHYDGSEVEWNGQSEVRSGCGCFGRLLSSDPPPGELLHFLDSHLEGVGEELYIDLLFIASFVRVGPLQRVNRTSCTDLCRHCVGRNTPINVGHLLSEQLLLLISLSHPLTSHGLRMLKCWTGACWRPPKHTSASTGPLPLHPTTPPPNNSATKGLPSTQDFWRKSLWMLFHVMDQMEPCRCSKSA